MISEAIHTSAHKRGVRTQCTRRASNPPTPHPPLYTNPLCCSSLILRCMELVQECRPNQLHRGGGGGGGHRRRLWTGWRAGPTVPGFPHPHTPICSEDVEHTSRRFLAHATEASPARLPTTHAHRRTPICLEIPYQLPCVGVGMQGGRANWGGGGGNWPLARL